MALETLGLAEALWYWYIGMVVVMELLLSCYGGKIRLELLVTDDDQVTIIN
jgi:hypothetical protein